MDKAFIGIRRIDTSSFSCICFSQESPAIIGQKSPHHLWDARNSLDCTNIKTKYIEQFNKETDLIDFLTVSTTNLPTTSVVDNHTEVNLCNPDRVVNIATLYMASALQLNVGNLMTDYDYDPAATNVFPNNSASGPSVIYPPDSLAEYPNLEQVYWTILAQYDVNTEPSLRHGKNNVWCYNYGVGMFDHCMDTNNKITKCEDKTVCKTAWANFIEACHRILSRDTSQGFYKSNGVVDQWCLPNNLVNSEYKLYYLYRR